MYTEHFGLTEKPFSISPDPRYLYLSQRHADALAHLLYGISESGGFIQLTGEVGTGKTTLIRSLLEQLPDKTEIALVLNPPLSTHEFLTAICQELRIELPPDQSDRALIDRLNERLLTAHSEDRRVVLIVDEAQTLSPELLEQIRLLTNLETAKRKLLQIILIGQPELRTLLDRPEMRQIAQRITGRYHLEPLSAQDAKIYIRHRMRVAGSQNDVFSDHALRQLYRRSAGIPRLINVIADRALLAAYTRDEHSIGASLVRQAAREVYGRRARAPRWAWLTGAVATALLAAAIVYLWPALYPAANRSAAVSSVEPAAPAADAPASTLLARGEDADGSARPADSASPLRSAHDSIAGPATGIMPLADFLAKHAVATDEMTAAATLFDLWGAGHPASRAQGCAQSINAGLQCLEFAEGSLHELRQIDRPVVAQLTDADGRTHYAVISRLGYDYAELRVGSASARVSIADLTHYWFGRHWLLWRPATEVSVSLRPGMRSERVVWLREALDEIGGDDPALRPASVGAAFDGDYYDAALESRVRAYQRSRRLSVDGIVGTRTQLALQADLGHPGGPILAEAN